MKTIQRVLRECDKEALEREWFRRYPIQFIDCVAHDTMLNDVIRKEHSQFRAFIDALCKTEADKESDSILLVCKCVDNESFWYDTILVKRDEVLEASELSEIQSYAYEFSDRTETLAYYVADNELTQRHIMELIISFLNELSQFGYEEAGLIAAQKRLKDIKVQMDNFDESKCIDFETAMDALGIEADSKYAAEDELESGVYNAVIKYNEYCREKELYILRNSLKKESAKYDTKDGNNE